MRAHDDLYRHSRTSSALRWVHLCFFCSLCPRGWGDQAISRSVISDFIRSCSSLISLPCRIVVHCSDHVTIPDHPDGPADRAPRVPSGARWRWTSPDGTMSKAPVCARENRWIISVKPCECPIAADLRNGLRFIFPLTLCSTCRSWTGTHAPQAELWRIRCK